MSVFDTTYDVIPQLDQIITVSGRRNDALVCTSLTRATGCGGTRAEIDAPQMLFDSYRDDLRDAQIAVWIRNAFDGSAPTAPDFVGFLDVDAGSLTTSNDSVSLSAFTITSYLSKVLVGQAVHRNTVRYRLYDPQTGIKTRWTLRRVLRDIFDNLPSYYRNYIRIGFDSVLDGFTADNTPELVFRGQSVAQALDAILAFFGDIEFTERFDEAGVCNLDFFRINDAGLPTVSVRVANYNDPIDAGANVGELQNTQSCQGAITRAIVYAAPRRYIITPSTVSTMPAHMRLVPGWKNPTVTIDGTETTHEDLIIKDPKRGRPGAPGYLPGMEDVLTKRYLPACLKGLVKLKEIPIERAAVQGLEDQPLQPGPKVSAQVWKYPTILTGNPVDGSFTGVLSTTPALIKSVKFNLDQDYFELSSAEDALNATAMSYDAAKKITVTTWERADIYITLCVEDEECLYSDTGQDHSSGINLPFGVDGLTEVIVRDDCQFIQFTNFGHPIKTSTGQSCYFPCTYLDEDTHTWHTFTSAQVYRDDQMMLDVIAGDVLRAKCRRHQAPTVKVPYFSRAYKPGVLLRIDGLQTPIPGPLMITSASYDLVGNSTRFTADNVKPPIRRVLAIGKTNNKWQDHGLDEDPSMRVQSRPVQTTPVQSSSNDGSLTVAENAAMNSYMAKPSAAVPLYKPQAAPAPIDDGSLTTSENAAMNSYNEFPDNTPLYASDRAPKPSVVKPITPQEFYTQPPMEGEPPPQKPERTYRLPKELTTAQTGIMQRIARGDIPENMSPAMVEEYRQRIDGGY